MRRRVLTALPLLVLGGMLQTAAVTSAQAPSRSLLLTHARLLDGTAAPVRDEMAVLVVDGRIERIAPADAIETTGAERVIDLEGRWLLPGFIDAHAHILDPEAAQRALRSGATTVRVLGDSYLRGMGTRDLIRGGHVAGPEILAAGAIVRPVLGEGVIVAFPQFGRFLDSPLQGAENVSAVVEALLARGADIIKVGASERAGLLSTDPRRTELDENEIRAAVDLAGREGKYVAAHAHAAAGADAAVRAGVRSIEHGTYVTDETLQLMLERGTWLVPTLAVMSPLADLPGQSAEAAEMRNRIWHMQSALHAAVREALRIGVRIAAATDGSYGDGDDTAALRVAHEVAELVALGMTPRQAIAAATSSAAELLGIDQRTGRIAEGLEADLLVFDRDPEVDLRVLFEPLLVINNGEVAIDRLY